MGRGRWKEQVKCKWWSATEGGRRWRILRCMPTPCHDQSTRWMIYFPAPILSPGKKKKKIYIPLNYWGFYFERRMWLWVCGCVGGKEWPSDVAIMKLKMSVLILILFLSPLIAPLFSSPFCGKCTEYTDIIKKKKREKLMRNSCRHIHQASFSDVYYVSVVMLLCKLLQTSETLCIFWIAWFLLPIHLRIWNNRKRYHKVKLWIALEKTLNIWWKILH